MSEYWLISVPGDKTCQQSWETMNNLTNKKHNLSDNYKFNIPDFKVGTLDQLVCLVDELYVLDSFAEQVSRIVAQYLSEVIEDHKDKLQENLMANNTDMTTYITRFQWDMARYPIKQSLRNIADTITKQVSKILEDCKVKSAAYDNLKSTLESMVKKQSANLLTRNLADLVKKEHFILDSEYLTTLLVVVRKSSFNDWKNCYEKLTDMIVPRSSELVYQDQEFGLFTVSLFKKVVDNFKMQAFQKKFVVRDFVYNEETAGINEIAKLETDKKKQFGFLVRWLKVNFSECFCAWIHVKALQVFVESVLRYGLPINFQAILIHPHKKSEKRLRELLNQLYAHLDSSAPKQGSQGAVNYNVDIPGLGFGMKEYYPYVYLTMNIDMLGTKAV